MTTTRAEHLTWCKGRAHSELNRCENQSALNVAFASFVSDLGKHPETSGHTAITLGVLLQMGGHLSTKQQMADFINGTN
jgi:hypothetical protein